MRTAPSFLLVVTYVDMRNPVLRPFFRNSYKSSKGSPSGMDTERM
jgi:hypothetical protein